MTFFKTCMSSLHLLSSNVFLFFYWKSTTDFDHVFSPPLIPPRSSPLPYPTIFMFLHSFFQKIKKQKQTNNVLIEIELHHFYLSSLPAILPYIPPRTSSYSQSDHHHSFLYYCYIHVYLCVYICVFTNIHT